MTIMRLSIMTNIVVCSDPGEDEGDEKDDHDGNDDNGDDNDDNDDDGDDNDVQRRSTLGS